MTTPTTHADALRAASAALRAAKREAANAERGLANAARDAVALSFKRARNGLNRYDESDLRNLGHLAIKANLLRAVVAHRRAAEQAALLAPQA
jgi:hypothetical protein